MAMVEQDTIVAISTPAGRGGIGVVRVSGAEAKRIVGPLLRLRHELAAGRARFGVVVDVGDAGGAALPTADPTHRAMVPRDEWGTEEEEAEADPCGMTNERESPVLDEVVVTFFAGPHAYTGEDVVEIAAHGSPVLLEYMVRACCAGGARLAEAGEFTQRAFLAGRIDLTQAEAVDDLIGSSTLEQARVAARQMGGALARVVGPVKAELVGLIAAMEAGIDFAEDDIDVMAADSIVAKIAEVTAPLVELERSFAFGRVVREGFSLAIVGRPNAGKSSLFNRLVERERAIVTAAPGTTRDTVTERVSMAGIPVELIDTAGLREATDEAERMGIARSREAMAEADVVVLVVDAIPDEPSGTSQADGRGFSDEEREVIDSVASQSLLIAFNKVDLLPEFLQERIRLMSNHLYKQRSVRQDQLHINLSERKLLSLHLGPLQAIPTSAVTGEGIEELRGAIVEAVGGGGGMREAGMLTNLRQHQAVSAALAGLDKGSAAVSAGIPHEMVLLDLYEALRGLDSLTGVTSSEDVLRLIFSRFCIGK